MSFKSIQIANDGYSTVSFKIENKNILKNISKVKIGLILELESDSVKSDIETGSGLSLYKFQDGENFPGKYLVEDYYVSIGEFSQYKDYLSNSSSLPPLGDKPEDQSYYDFDAYVKNEEIFLNSLSNIRGYKIDLLARAKSASFVFTMLSEDNQSLFLDSIKSGSVAEYRITNGFVSAPYILKPGIFRVDGDVVTPNISSNISGISSSIKSSIEEIFGNVSYDYSASGSLFRLNKYTKNPVVIACNYNPSIRKSKYNLYVNGKKHPVKKRVISSLTPGSETLIFVINLKKSFENSGHFEFSVIIEDDYVYTSSNEYAKSILTVLDDEEDSLSRNFASFFMIPDYMMKLSRRDEDGTFKLGFQIPSLVRSLNYKLNIIGSAKSIDADPGDLGSEDSRSMSIDSSSENPEYSSDLGIDDVSDSLSEDERFLASLVGSMRSTISEAADKIFGDNSSEDAKFLSGELDKNKKEGCDGLNLSLKSVMAKILGYFEKNKVPMSSTPSKYFNSIVSFREGGFFGLFSSGTKIDKIKTVYSSDGSIHRRSFAMVLMNSNGVSSNPKIVSINGTTDFSEVAPSEVERIVLVDPAENINIAINNITFEASNINQNVVDVSISEPSKIKMQEQSNLVLECNSKIAVTRPDDIVDTPDNPEVEDPCKEKRERSTDPEEKPDGPGLSFAGIKLPQAPDISGDVQSFCDFSFSLTKELKYGLKGFEKVLSVVKVVFCIVDVLCSLTNPVKYFRALVRLFECLWELISLLPQVSIPVMYFDLLAHILELLKCVFDKIAYYIIALDEIISSLNSAWQNKDLTSVYNLETTLSKYLVTFEAELDVLRPVFDIIDIFKRLLDMAFNLPCQLNLDESELDYFCVDNTIASAIIASKIESPDNLLMAAQTYTTEETGSCGNTPPFKNASEFADLSPNVRSKINSKCDDWDLSDSRVLLYPDEFSGNRIGSPDSISEDVDIASYRVKGSEFEGTFKMSATKIIKAPLGSGLEGIVGTTRASNRVYISFGNNLSLTGNPKDEVNPAGLTAKSAFYKIPISFAKNISLNDNLDDAVSLLTTSGNDIVVGGPQSAGLFSGHSKSIILLDGDKEAGMHPKPLSVELGSESVSYSNIPSFMIVDEDGDVYAIEENGIKFDDRGFIKGIFAKIINENSAVRKNFSKEDEVSIVDQGVLDAQANFEIIKQILFQEGISFSNQRHGRKIAPASGYASFIRNKESLQDSVQSIESRMVNPDAGAYDFLGGTDSEVEEYQEAVKLVEVYQFIDIYFVDIGSTVEELIIPCETQSQSFDNLEIPSAEEVLDAVNQGEDCLNEIKDYVEKNNKKIRDDIAAGTPPTNPYSLSEMYNKYESSVACIDGLLDLMCTQSVSYLATSFKIDGDAILNENGSVDPNSLDPSIFPNDISEEYISGLGPSFTGAIEYASGIGDKIESRIDSSVKISIVPRNIYDQQFDFNFSKKIKINIEKDTTGNAFVSEIYYDSANLASFAYISSSAAGEVVISAEICGKSIKALTYDGTTVEFSDNDCTVINTDSLTSDLALGSVKTMKRTLSIEFVGTEDGTFIAKDSAFNNNSETLRSNMNYGE